MIKQSEVAASSGTYETERRVIENLKLFRKTHSLNLN